MERARHSGEEVEDAGDVGAERTADEPERRRAAGEPDPQGACRAFDLRGRVGRRVEREREPEQEEAGRADRGRGKRLRTLNGRRDAGCPEHERGREGDERGVQQNRPQRPARRDGSAVDAGKRGRDRCVWNEPGQPAVDDGEREPRVAEEKLGERQPQETVVSETGPECERAALCARPRDEHRVGVADGADQPACGDRGGDRQEKRAVERRREERREDEHRSDRREVRKPEPTAKKVGAHSLAE